MVKFLIIFMFFAGPIFAKEERFSGLSIPRFSSLKGEMVNTRFGPGLNYPIKYIYNSRFEPVKVINEFYGWYQIEDINKDISWINKINLTSKSYAKVNTDITNIYKSKKENSKIIARAKKGIIFLIDDCNDLWCQIKTNYDNQEFNGYVKKIDLFGI